MGFYRQPVFRPGRQQFRKCLQIPGHGNGQQAEEANAHGNFHPAQRQMMDMGVKGRTEQQVVLQPDAEHDGQADHRHGLGVGLDPAVDQDDERRHETADENRPGQSVPGRGHGAFDDVAGLFGNVAVPDDHELGVEEIGPHQTEGEEELADVVKLVLRHAVVVFLAEVQPGAEHDQRAEADVDRLDEAVGAEQGRVPVRVGGHHQVVADQREYQGEGQQVEDGKGGGARGELSFVESLALPAFQQAAAQRSRRAPLLQGEVEAVIEKDDANPVEQAQADKITAEEEGHVEPDLLAVQIRVHPGKDVLTTQKENQKEH
ncbi:hypothetical protein DESC_770027 [Desulfosarcina cetonica]|nr:hypothetical protein DESC_770027 [Desulfosarcina cetonica]